MYLQSRFPEARITHQEWQVEAGEVQSARGLPGCGCRDGPEDQWQTQCAGKYFGAQKMQLVFKHILFACYCGTFKHKRPVQLQSAAYGHYARQGLRLEAVHGRYDHSSSLRHSPTSYEANDRLFRWVYQQEAEDGEV